MNQAQRQSPPPLADASSPQRRLLFLLVDDEPDVLESLKELLELAIPDVEILTANSGDEALSMLEGVDLIVADYHMPGMDGIGFLAHCSELRPTARRILLTAFPGPVPILENRARREANVAAFVSKGVGPQALIDAVRTVLSVGTVSAKSLG